jgi:hypothetical protein
VWVPGTLQPYTRIGRIRTLKHCFHTWNTCTALAWQSSQYLLKRTRSIPLQYVPFLIRLTALSALDVVHGCAVIQDAVRSF